MASFYSRMGMQVAEAMFDGNEGSVFKDIRALVPIPSLTMHFAAPKDRRSSSLTDMRW